MQSESALLTDWSLPREGLAGRYARIRARSLELASPLSEEDQCVQSMPDASPTKWHLAHTTWFFERLVLARFVPEYRPYDARFDYLFNSYYESLGPRHPRPLRGLLTRPSASEVRAYRHHVDGTVIEWLQRLEPDDAIYEEAAACVELGLQHEQQHQELILADILHAFSCNPLLPAYRAADAVDEKGGRADALRWIEMPGGVVEMGHPLERSDFAFDNEKPRHPVMLHPYAIADRLVTCGEYAAFIAAGGYRNPEWWLSEGWDAVRAGGWAHPLYWLPSSDAEQDEWHVFGLEGVRPMYADQPVSNLSFYEAAAYAAWAGARLPTEFEWEAASALPSMREQTGHAWQWTRSSYDPYPGFRPHPGAAAEYNGKFMLGQLVLRGGSHATPQGHARPTYRNFFPPHARWQFAGLRLARDLST